MDNFQRYHNLWNQDEEYSDDDFQFLKRSIREKNIKVKYAFYKKESLKGKQIALIFDMMPDQLRKSGVENKWEIICSREITGKEIEEFITQYFRTSYQRFLVFYYKNIEKLIFDDHQLQAITPEKFIRICNNKKLCISPLE